MTTAAHSAGATFAASARQFVAICARSTVIVPVAPATSLALEEYRANVNLFTELARYVAAYEVFGQGTLIVAASGNESDRPSY